VDDSEEEICNDEVGRNKKGKAVQNIKESIPA
jgi:hypothetical protein